MNTLYVRLAGIGVLVIIIVSTGLYIDLLKTRVDNLKKANTAQSVTISDQRDTIHNLTTSQKDFEDRLKLANLQSVIIQERVVTKLKYLPAPNLCEPAIEWLRSRAME